MKYAIALKTSNKIGWAEISDNELESLQCYVSGYIEVVSLSRIAGIDADVDLIINDEGAINGSELNVLASLLAGTMIFGNALIAKVNGENFEYFDDDEIFGATSCVDDAIIAKILPESAMERRLYDV